MNVTPEFILAIVLSGIGFIVWLVRLEGVSKGAYREIELTNKRLDSVQTKHDVLQAKHEDLDSKIVRDVAEIKVSIARIESYMKARNEFSRGGEYGS